MTTSAIAAAERQLYADQWVLISTTRLIVNSVSYPLSKISSVHLLKRTPDRRLVALLTLLGIIFLFIQVVIGVGPLVTVALLVWIMKAKFVMLVGSAGGERAAVSSSNMPHMSHVIEQASKAIVERGRDAAS